MSNIYLELKSQPFLAGQQLSKEFRVEDLKQIVQTLNAKGKRVKRC